MIKTVEWLVPVDLKFSSFLRTTVHAMRHRMLVHGAGAGAGTSTMDQAWSMRMHGHAHAAMAMRRPMPSMPNATAGAHSEARSCSQDQVHGRAMAMWPRRSIPILDSLIQQS